MKRKTINWDQDPGLSIIYSSLLGPGVGEKMGKGQDRPWFFWIKSGYSQEKDIARSACLNHSDRGAGKEDTVLTKYEDRI